MGTISAYTTRAPSPGKPLPIEQKPAFPRQQFLHWIDRLKKAVESEDLFEVRRATWKLWITYIKHANGGHY